MEKERLPQQDIRQQYRLCAAVGLILLLFYLPQALLGDLWSRFSSFDLFRMTVFISLMVSLRLFRASLAELLLLLYALWFFFSRLLLGEALGVASLYHLVGSVLFPACYLSMGCILSQKDRLRLLELVLGLVTLFWLLLALLGLYATVRLERVPIPFTSFTAGLDYVSMNNQMTIAHVNRNISAGWFGMGLFFSLWLFFRSEKRLLRLLWGAAVPVFYAAVSMSMSRTVGLSTALGLSLLLFLLLSPRLRARFPALFPLLAALLLISLPLFYRGQSLITRSFSASAESLWYARGMDKLQPAPTPTPTPLPQPEETPFVRPRKEAEHFFDDTRSDSNIRSIGSRSTLWYCGLQVLREDSRQLLLGGSVETYMLPVNRHSQALLGIDHERDYYHMHNFLFDALMLCGLPGFLLLLAFTLLLSLRILRVLLCPDPVLPLGLRLLTLPLIGQLLINMAEAFLLRSSLLCTLLFFLIAGVFLRWSEELLPHPTI